MQETLASKQYDPTKDHNSSTSELKDTEIGQVPGKYFKVLSLQ